MHDEDYNTYVTNVDQQEPLLDVMLAILKAGGITMGITGVVLLLGLIISLFSLPPEPNYQVGQECELEGYLVVIKGKQQGLYQIDYNGFGSLARSSQLSCDTDHKL